VGENESRVRKRKTGLLFLYKVGEHGLSLTYSFQLRAEGRAEGEAEWEQVKAELAKEKQVCCSCTRLVSIIYH
jgi:hypothetical protein